MVESNIKQLLELHRSYQEADAAWFRHLLTLAAGALILVPVTGQVEAESVLAQRLPAGTWVCLGTAILSGFAATYLQVDRAKKQLHNYKEELSRSLREGTPMGAVRADPNKIFLQSRWVMVAALSLAMIFLVGHLLLITLAA